MTCFWEEVLGTRVQHSTFSFPSAAVIEHGLNSSFSFILGSRVRMAQGRNPSRPWRTYLKSLRLAGCCYCSTTLCLPHGYRPGPFSPPNSWQAFCLSFCAGGFLLHRIHPGDCSPPAFSSLASWSTWLQNVLSWSILHPLSLSGVHRGSQPFAPIRTFTHPMFPLPMSLHCL